MAEQIAAFRVDASVEIGSGHVMRCLTLADALRSRGETCHFICRDLPGHLGAVIAERGYEVHLLPAPGGRSETSSGDVAHASWLGTDWQTDARECASHLLRIAPDWVVVDHYALDRRWEQAAVPSASRLIVIDDLADRAHQCAVLVDQTPGRVPSAYNGLVPDDCTCLRGASFALLRPEFQARREASLVRRATAGLDRVVIAMGGYDKDNATIQAMRVLARAGIALAHVDVILGAKAPWLDEVRAEATAMPWPTDLHIDAPAVSELFAAADLAIGAAGVSALERCCLGLPSLLLVLAENQLPSASALDAGGAAVCLGKLGEDGWPAALERELKRLAKPSALQTMAGAAATVTDGRGVKRVVNAMTAAALTVRRADEHDAKRVWEWRHAGDVSKYNRTPGDIPWPDHARWFAQAVSSPDRLMLIVAQGEEPIAHVRFDRDIHDRTRARLSLALAPQMRGRGLSAPVLARALAAAREQGIESFIAEVHEENLPSKALFDASDFSPSGIDSPYLQYELAAKAKDRE